MGQAVYIIFPKRLSQVIINYRDTVFLSVDKVVLFD